jgi:2-dehydropantoate 2-reductase
MIVMGAGGVGGYFGAKLSRAGVSVTMVARGPHGRAIRDAGLRVRSTIEGEWVVNPAVVDDLTGSAPADAVLLAVKAFDTDSALERIRPALEAGTPVLTLQNGIDAIERIDRTLGAGHALGGAAYVFAAIESPGVIAHRFAGRIVFGEPNGRITPRAARLYEILVGAGVPVELSTNIRRVLWEKYLFICAHAGMTALCRGPIGLVRSVPETWLMYRRLLEELARLAEASGVELPSDVVDTLVTAAEALGPEASSSLHHDLERGRPLELDALHGRAVRLGSELGVPTPMLFAVYAALAPHAGGRSPAAVLRDGH